LRAVCQSACCVPQLQRKSESRQKRVRPAAALARLETATIRRRVSTRVRASGRLARASAACRRLMTIPGVGQLTALAFVAAIDDPSRIRRSRDIGAYLGLVPRRYQSGEVDYVGSISKCGDRRVRTLLYEAANVMLTRYKGQLKLKDWAFAIARLSKTRKPTIRRRLFLWVEIGQPHIYSEWSQTTTESAVAATRVESAPRQPDTKLRNRQAGREDRRRRVEIAVLPLVIA
jgi:hypothetical protein